MKNKISKSTLSVFIILGCIIAIIAFIWWRLAVFFTPKDVQHPDYSPDDISVENEDYFVIQDVTETEDDGVTTILVLGDDSFAYERGPEGLASLLADECDATVYNCAFEGSSFSGETAVLNYEDYPIECFSAVRLLTNINYNDYTTLNVGLDNLEARGELPDYFRDTAELLQSIDLDTIDVIILSYGINDYLLGHVTTDLTNEESCGSVWGSIIMCVRLIRQTCPHAQIVINSPSYAYYTEEDGTLVGGDFKKTGTTTSENLGGYMINMKNTAVQENVTFIDNYFGVPIYYENADQYLTESPIVPNLEGRKLIAAHIADVVNHHLY